MGDWKGGGMWGGLYEVGRDKRMFMGGEGMVKYKLRDTDKERRGGYAWYGKWGSKV
uniref:pectate lyase n=1 Tax=Paenibacillus xylanexedens TaxID=528191 RepID=UPI001C92E6E3